jgi:cell division protein FtsB
MKQATKRGLDPFWILFFFTSLLIVSLAVYVSNILFGDKSLEVYNSLKEQSTILQNEIEQYKYDNAKLQKEYFELKELEPKDGF